MTFSDLITDFAARLGMTIEPDADGVYSFDGEGITFTIHDLSPVGQVALTGDVGLPPPEKPEKLYKLVLEAQYLFQETQGATMSLNPETGRFTLCRTLPLDALTPDAFFALAEQFVNTLEAWAQIIQNYRPAVDQPAGNDVEADQQSALFSGFIQA